jgi:hypothetical protein
VCAAAGSALVLALVWRWLGSYGQLLFAGTIVRGLLIGGLLTWVIRRTNFSSAFAAGTLAALATLFAIVGANYEAHTRVRAEVLADAAELLQISTGAGTDPSEVEQHYRDTEEALTFSNYLRGYFGFEGQAEDGAAALWGPWAGIGLYGLEIAAALALATVYPVGQASEPVCARCGRWQNEVVAGTSAFGNTEKFIGRLLAPDLDAALQCLTPPDTKEHMELSLATCALGHDAGKGAVLRVRDQVYGSRDHNLLLRDRADLQLEQAECDAIASRLETWA